DPHRSVRGGGTIGEPGLAGRLLGPARGQRPAGLDPGLCRGRRPHLVRRAHLRSAQSDRLLPAVARQRAARDRRPRPDPARRSPAVALHARTPLFIPASQTRATDGRVPSFPGEEEQMTVTAFLGEYDNSKGREGGIGIGQNWFDGRGDGVKINFPAGIPRNASGHIIIAADSFERLALAMMASDREAAIKAFGAALQTDCKEALKAFGVTVLERAVSSSEDAA